MVNNKRSRGGKKESGSGLVHAMQCTGPQAKFNVPLLKDVHHVPYASPHPRALHISTISHLSFGGAYSLSIQVLQNSRHRPQVTWLNSMTHLTDSVVVVAPALNEELSTAISSIDPSALTMGFDNEAGDGWVEVLNPQTSGIDLLQFMQNLVSARWLQRDIAFSFDCKHVILGSYDDDTRIWDVGTQEMVGGPLQGHTGWVTSVAFSPDCKCTVSGLYDTTIRIWDVETQEMMGEPLRGHESCVALVVFSPDSKHVVSGSWDKMVRIWDTQMQVIVGGPLLGHTSWVTSIAFSPDGKCVVSGSQDKMVRVWDAETQVIVGGPLVGHTSDVTSVAFSMMESTLSLDHMTEQLGSGIHRWHHHQKNELNKIGTGEIFTWIHSSVDWCTVYYTSE